MALLTKWRYLQNVDTTTNSYGGQLADICELHSIHYTTLAIMTRFGVEKSHITKPVIVSQINLLFTNKNARKQIVDNDWHMADHVPLSLNLRIPFQSGLC